MHNLSQAVKMAKAIAPAVALGTGAAWTAIEVDATGFDRVCYVLYWGSQAGATKAGVTSFQVEEATASGGTFTAISASASSVGTGDSDDLIIVDVPVTYTSPYQKFNGTSGTEGTSACTVAAVALLYRGTRQLPIAQTIGAIVC
jgi:hypothetical protein